MKLKVEFGKYVMVIGRKIITGLGSRRVYIGLVNTKMSGRESILIRHQIYGIGIGLKRTSQIISTEDLTILDEISCTYR